VLLVAAETPAWEDRIAIDEAVLAGKPVIRGTRLAVDFVLELLAEGWSQEEILANYPQLQRDDILAALHWASEVLRAEKVYPLPAKLV
jgi:uncharacterized protein (DUF433 family)